MRLVLGRIEPFVVFGVGYQPFTCANFFSLDRLPPRVCLAQPKRAENGGLLLSRQPYAGSPGSGRADHAGYSSLDLFVLGVGQVLEDTHLGVVVCDLFNNLD